MDEKWICKDLIDKEIPGVRDEKWSENNELTIDLRRVNPWLKKNKYI